MGGGGGGGGLQTDRCTHAGMQDAGRPLSSAPTGRADRPSVTVSRWIKGSERGAQRREEEARNGREKRREEGSNLILLQELFSVFLWETAPDPAKKDLILPPPPPPPPPKAAAAAAPLKLTVSLLSVSLSPLSLSVSAKGQRCLSCKALCSSWEPA